MNVADTERMEALMLERGGALTEQIEEADVIVINGCSVREKAVHKAVSYLGEHKGLKTRYEGPVIALGGCVGQLDQGEIFKRAPYVDFVFGPDAIDQLPELVDRAKRGERHFVQAEFDKTLSYSTQTKVKKNKALAFVNIMKGCDKYCTYCIVPFTRGREKSRTIQEVLDDVAALVSQGVREVTLLGQNVNSFGKGNPNTAGYEPAELSNPIGKVGPRPGEENFVQLLYAMNRDPRLKQLKRIRFTSSHPLDFSDQLIGAYADPKEGGVDNLAKHLHLPVQSGSNAILQKMGRHHKVETYVEQMKVLKSISPDIGLSTDIIVGFPGETEEDFEATLKLLTEIEYDNIYAFSYSPRPGTRAEKLVDDVSKKVKSERLARVMKHQLDIAEGRYAERIGRTMEVLVVGLARNDGMLANSKLGRVWTGHTTCNRVVNFIDQSGRNLEGSFLNIKITNASGLSLQGDLIHDAGFAEGISVA